METKVSSIHWVKHCITSRYRHVSRRGAIQKTELTVLFTHMTRTNILDIWWSKQMSEETAVSSEAMEDRYSGRSRGSMQVWCWLEAWQNGLLPAKPASAKHKQELKRGWTLPCCCWLFWKDAHHVHAETDLLIHVHTRTHARSTRSPWACVSESFPGMFWLLLTKRGILLGKLHLSKSLAVILTNEPWKSEEMCVYVCNGMHVGLWIHTCVCVCVFFLEHKHAHHEDRCVHEVFFSFSIAAGWSQLYW